MMPDAVMFLEKLSDDEVVRAIENELVNRPLR
jgi:hypothetical protein